MNHVLPNFRSVNVVSLIISEKAAKIASSVSSKMVNSTRHLTNITMRHGTEK